MAIEFKPIAGRSRRFYLLTFILGALVFAGAYSTWQMSQRGLYLSGMNNRLPWGLPIVMAVFYIGLSAGSLVISSLYGVFGKLEYKPFARVATFAAMVLMIGGILSILSDQGRLDRVLVSKFWASWPSWDWPSSGDSNCSSCFRPRRRPESSKAGLC
jgi:molybdopterin-containing oxidoreductase family membrane subunit